jgi:hypothetical protein
MEYDDENECSQKHTQHFISVLKETIPEAFTAQSHKMTGQELLTTSEREMTSTGKEMT